MKIIITLAFLAGLSATASCQGIGVGPDAPLGAAHLLGLDAGAQYAGGEFVLDLSLAGSSPGLQLGSSGRTIPLNRPWIYTDHAGFLYPSIYQGFHGNLDALGQAVAVLQVPYHPILLGLQVSSCFVTADFGSSDGLGFISAPASFTIVPETTGWSAWAPSASSLLIYVSSSEGSDTNTGLSPQDPVATIQKGYSLLRAGQPDWLHLKSGDTWLESLGHWKKPGLSAAEPMVVTSYGDSGPRPLLKTGPQQAGLRVQGGGGAPPSLEHLSIVGISFYAHTRDPSSPTFAGPDPAAGVAWVHPGQNLCIEDCAFRFYSTNLSIQSLSGTPGLQGFTLRRSLMLDAYGISGAFHSQGIYLDNAHDVLIEGNLFDHNGWNDSVPGAEPTIFNHNMYIQHGNTGVVVRGNISARASSHGLQLRPGGICEDNLFVANPLGILLGTTAVTTPAPAGTPPSAIVGNVITEGGDIDAQNPRGFAIDLVGVDYGATIRDNIIAHEASNFPYTRAIHLDPGNTSNLGIVIENNTVHAWPGGNLQSAASSSTISVELNLLDQAASFTSNLLSSTVPFFDPTRTLATYSQSFDGPASSEAFLAETRQQSRAGWRHEYTAPAVLSYIRLGFQPMVDLGDPRVGAVLY